MNNRDEFVEPFNSGVKDCNGVYICNGDTIIEEHLLNDNVIQKAYGVVRFEDGAFVVDMGKLGTYTLKDRKPYENKYNTFVYSERLTINYRHGGCTINSQRKIQAWNCI